MGCWESPFGLYWPRQVYGRVVEELSAQGAKAIAFDVLFGELRPDHPPVQMADGSFMESDDFFAAQMRRAGNVIYRLYRRSDAAGFVRHQLSRARRHLHRKGCRRRFAPRQKFQI